MERAVDMKTLLAVLHNSPNPATYNTQSKAIS